jgi:cytosine/adenosine deaminase-related metal-dependent hydrolase
LTVRRSTLVLRARVVLPVRLPPITDGAVVVSGGRVVRVGAWADLRPGRAGRTLDLGEVALLPGLVNAHCHLDYTHMAGLFPPPKSFCDWIKCITTEKAQWQASDYLKSWLAGAAMLVRNGTTTVGDVEVVPQLLARLWRGTPLRVFSFLEMTGIRSRRNPAAILDEALAHIRRLRSDRCEAHLSPHAPYSTVPRLLRLSGQAAREHRLRLTTHLAESGTEFEMFTHGRGEMFDWLQRSERDMRDCGRGSPIQHAARVRLLGRHLLAIHVNYLAPGDAELLAKRGVSVVHCPRSHAYFRHHEFPRRKLAKAGVNVCLGTDSLASVRCRAGQAVELSLFDELRTFAAAHSGVRPPALLEMVTCNGARALGLAGRAGEISAGACADLIAVPCHGELRNAAETVIHHRGPVTASMIAGKWVFPRTSRGRP